MKSTTEYEYLNNKGEFEKVYSPSNPQPRYEVTLEFTTANPQSDPARYTVFFEFAAYSDAPNFKNDSELAAFLFENGYKRIPVTFDSTADNEIPVFVEITTQLDWVLQTVYTFKMHVVCLTTGNLIQHNNSSKNYATVINFNIKKLPDKTI